MNNIITNKIPAALRWVCLYAPAEYLSGVSTTPSDNNENEEEETAIDIIEEEDFTINAGGSNILTPQNGALIRVVRVKNSTWHRAILGDSLIKEDSDEYLQVHDTNGAEATVDRPQAALINTKVKKVEIWPNTAGTVTLTYIKALTASDIGDLTDPDTHIGIPSAVETSFIYYLAYLLCSAYGDARAKSMFDIATLNLGRSEDKQRQ
jgi:hypothetical protein